MVTIFPLPLSFSARTGDLTSASSFRHCSIRSQRHDAQKIPYRRIRKHGFADEQFRTHLSEQMKQFAVFQIQEEKSNVFG